MTIINYYIAAMCQSLFYFIRILNMPVNVINDKTFDIKYYVVEYLLYIIP